MLLFQSKRASEVDFNSDHFKLLFNKEQNIEDKNG